MHKILKGLPFFLRIPTFITQGGFRSRGREPDITWTPPQLEPFGEGASGVSPKLGWNPNDFKDYVNRTETDTARDRNTRGRQTPHLKLQPPADSREWAADDAIPNRYNRQRCMTAVEEHSTGFPILGGPAPRNRNTSNDCYARLSPSHSCSRHPKEPSQAIYPVPGPGNAPLTSAGPGSMSSFLHELGLGSPTNNSTDLVSPSLPPPRIDRGSTAMAGVPEECETFDPKFEEAGKLIAYAQTLSLLRSWN